MPTATEARRWLDRWDRQQERYVADREERFAVIADVVAAAADRDEPRVLDLGCGPGSLSVRLLERFPAASVVAVDADPLLLGLARAAYADRPGLTVLSRDLRSAGWDDGLGEFDAIVSTTALHWLTRPELGALYASCAGLLRAGGVLVNGDHLRGHHLPGGGRLDDLASRVERGRAARVGVLDNEDWGQWWDAVAAAPELADLVGERGARPLDHTVPDVPGLADHVALLREAGFAETGTVWQHGTDRVLVAVR